tara:strand:+ start:334 stop:534 length:201 start_codon:yes stop_codon:yes gene_type:complete
MSLKLSDQAVATLLMTLQRCLSEQSDITELLNTWNLSENDGQLFVDNPPSVKANEDNFKNSNSNTD